MNFKLKTVVLIFTLNLFTIINGFTQSSENSAKVIEKISLSEKDLDIFKEQTKQKVNEFQNHILILSDKTQSRSKRNMAEKEALKLFYDGAIMEISLLINGKTIEKERPMAEYLFRLKTINFTKVEITFFDIVYVTEFTRAPDGKYHGIATFFQKFQGFQGDKITYSDITKKEISIIIDLIEDDFYNEKQWKLFLGDIRATETKRK